MSNKMKTNCRLSKVAMFLRNEFNLPDVCARIIGQFAGTDRILLPGDDYIRLRDSKDCLFVFAKSIQDDYIRLRGSLAPRNEIYSYRYDIFDVYTIKSVTPCTYMCEYEKSFHVFTKFCKHFIFVTGRDPNATYSPRRFYGGANTHHTIAQIKQYDLTKAVPAPEHFNHYMVEVKGRKLILK